MHLADGREAEAKLLDADAELGVAVYALPDDAEGVRGLRVAETWDELAGGSLAVVAGGTGNGLMGLSLLRTVDARLGRLDAADGPSGAALVGVKGTLLGLRSTSRVVDTTSCQACHQPTRADVRVIPPGTAVVADEYATALRAWTTASTSSSRAEASPHFIPGPVIHRVLQDLDAHGRIRHGYLGVVLGDAAGEGVRLSAVLADSPAQAAGLKTGQRIVSVDGVPALTSAVVSRALALKRPGEEVVFGVTAGGKDDAAADVKVALADRTEAQKDMVTAETVGLECVELDRGLRRYLGLDEDTGGVVVQDVRHGSAAHRAGMRRGDLIQWGGDGPVTNMEELHAALAGGDGSVELRAMRGDREYRFKLAVNPNREAPR